MATILCRKGYGVDKASLPESSIEQIKKQLIVSPKVQGDYGMGPDEWPVYRQSPKRLYLPKFYAMERFGPPKDPSHLSKGNDIDLEFDGQLREHQLEVVDLSMKAYSEQGGGLISVFCGGGKTTIALWLLCQLKKKTIIFVHTEFLMDQWIERIEQFLPQARVGRIRQNIYEVEDKDIVLATIQTFTRRDFPKEELDTFGHLIIDECHHIACKVFSQIFFKLQTPYMLGLSATPDRKDGLTKVIHWFIGPIIICLKREVNKPLIKRIEYHDPNFEEKFNVKGQPNIPLMVTDLTVAPDRNKMILEELKKLYDEGRKILILTDRLKHCEYFVKLCSPLDMEIGKYVGGMKTNERSESTLKRVIVATYMMAAEGFDCPDLDTLILATPKSDVEQAVGRILRRKNDHDPLVVDIIDCFSVFERQAIKRLRYYRKSKYILEDDKQKAKNNNNKNTNKNSKGKNNKGSSFSPPSSKQKSLTEFLFKD